MSISFKFLLNKRRKNATNVYPVILRVYVNRDYKEHSMNFKVHEADWDEEKQLVNAANPSCKIYNAKILSDKSKLEKLILLSDWDIAHVTAGIILQSAFPVTEQQANEKISNTNFIDYGTKQVQQLKSIGKVGNAMVYECAINKINEYAGKKLAFKDLNYKLLTAFTNKMLQNGIKVNTVSVYMRTIRAIYNRARKEGIVMHETYPFDAYRIKSERTINRALSLSEIQSIVTQKLEKDTHIWHWRNYFLLSFCLIGINFADLFKLTSNNIVDGRVVFRRSKTGKLYSIKLQDKAKELLSYYLGDANKQDYIIPILRQGETPLQQKNRTKQAVKTCNEYLKRIATSLKIEKDISTYYARYTWANIAKLLGYSKDMIAEALGHEYGNRVTGIYLDNYDNDVIDEMNERVIAAIFNEK